MMYERKYGLFCYLVSTQKLQKTACLILGRQFFWEVLLEFLKPGNGNIVKYTISLEEIVKRDRCWSGKILNFDHFISKYKRII